MCTLSILYAYLPHLWTVAIVTRPGILMSGAESTVSTRRQTHQLLWPQRCLTMLYTGRSMAPQKNKRLPRLDEGATYITQTGYLVILPVGGDTARSFPSSAVGSTVNLLPPKPMSSAQSTSCSASTRCPCGRIFIFFKGYIYKLRKQSVDNNINIIAIY